MDGEKGRDSKTREVTQLIARELGGGFTIWRGKKPGLSDASL